MSVPAGRKSKCPLTSAMAMAERWLSALPGRRRSGGGYRRQGIYVASPLGVIVIANLCVHESAICHSRCLMSEPPKAVREHHPTPVLRDRDGAPTGPRFRLIAAGRDCVNDMMAGLVASVVLIANIVSFGALMFPGDLSAGISTAIWAM